MARILTKDSDEWQFYALLLGLVNDCSDNIIQYLVQQWPHSVKNCDGNSATPLHYACKRG